MLDLHNISYFLLYHLYLPYDLFLNESVFITINNFLLLSMANMLTISRADGRLLLELINGQFQ